MSWTHFIALIPLKEPLQRDFYAEMCRVQRWSVRALRQQIDSMLYERTALSRQPEAGPRERRLPFRGAWRSQRGYGADRSEQGRQQREWGTVKGWDGEL